MLNISGLFGAPFPVCANESWNSHGNLVKFRWQVSTTFLPFCKSIGMPKMKMEFLGGDFKNS